MPADVTAMRTKCRSNQRNGRKPINQLSNFPGKTSHKLPRRQAATIRKNAEACSATDNSVSKVPYACLPDVTAMRTKCRSYQRKGRKPINHLSNFPGNYSIHFIQKSEWFFERVYIFVM
jgi:hypothetical protein